MILLNVTKNTQSLLESRMDDFRIACAYDVMYGDNIGGVAENRTFTFLDKDENQVVNHLRKACIGDLFDYLYVSAAEFMPQTIEENIVNIQRMKKVGASPNGLPPIKDVWVFIFTLNKEGEVLIDSFMNPDSRDCSAIVHGENQVIFACFINTYKIADEVQKEQLNQINGVNGLIDEVFQFTFMSPMDATKLDEYEAISRLQESEALQKAFMIQFK